MIRSAERLAGEHERGRRDNQQPRRSAHRDAVPGGEEANQRHHLQAMKRGVRRELAEPRRGRRASRRLQPFRSGPVGELAPHGVDRRDADHHLEQPADQQDAQRLRVARRGVEQRPQVHPDRRRLPAAQRREERGRRRCSAGNVGRHVATGREVLLVEEEAEVRRAAPEEIALEVTRDHQHTVHLPLEHGRPRGSQILHVARQPAAAGRFEPARGDARAGAPVEIEHGHRQVANYLRGEHPHEQQRHRHRYGAEQRPQNREAGESPELPARDLGHAAHRRAFCGQSTSALIPGRSAGRGWTGRARTSNVRTSNPPASRVARQVAKAPSGEMK